MKRKRNQNSKAAHEFTKPAKKAYWEKIMDALNDLKGGATFEELADKAGLRPDQVWRRLSEMERDGKIFNTGVSRPLKSGCSGAVWQSSNSSPSKIENIDSNSIIKSIEPVTPEILPNLANYIPKQKKTKAAVPEINNPLFNSIL
jgi:hypothetical protein